MERNVKKITKNMKDTHARCCATYKETYVLHNQKKVPSTPATLLVLFLSSSFFLLPSPFSLLSYPNNKKKKK
jgi:hypothetical protein